MRRVSVVGVSGSGKTTLARSLAERLGAPLVELDALMHQRGWQPRPEDEFREEVERATLKPEWVIDGNYRQVVIEGPVWQRADTAVWLDLPRLTVMRQLVARTVRRAVTREVLWNGNREPLSSFISLDRERSVIVWAWVTYQGLTERYSTAMSDPKWRHMKFVRLRSNADANRWLRSVGREPG
ncbi:MAG: AAA family ATPase [Candidatus Dormibacteraeota bacterium]|nr:AAA family ATPase [Candidatus Dormibacteraeota bacterium]